MKRIGEYVIVNDIKELTESDVIWAEETAIRINGYGIFRDIDKIDFRLVFNLCYDFLHGIFLNLLLIMGTTL